MSYNNTPRSTLDRVNNCDATIKHITPYAAMLRDDIRQIDKEAGTTHTSEMAVKVDEILQQLATLRAQVGTFRLEAIAPAPEGGSL